MKHQWNQRHHLTIWTLQQGLILTTAGVCCPRIGWGELLADPFLKGKFLSLERKLIAEDTQTIDAIKDFLGKRGGYYSCYENIFGLEREGMDFSCKFIAKCTKWYNAPSGVVTLYGNVEKTDLPDTKKILEEISPNYRIDTSQFYSVWLPIEARMAFLLAYHHQNK